jgi:hypothetical protein
MLFGNSKKEIEDLQKKVNQAISDICQIQQQQELLKTNQNSLRGLVNKKLSGEKVESQEAEESKDIKGMHFY